jgi:hypothetical protein
MKSLAPACNDRLWAVSAVHPPQFPEELTTVEGRHPAVDENGVRHRKRANCKRLAYIGSFGHLEIHAFKNTADNLSDYGGVVHHQDVPHPRTFVP